MKNIFPLLVFILTLSFSGHAQQPARQSLTPEQKQQQQERRNQQQALARSGNAAAPNNPYNNVLPALDSFAPGQTYQGQPGGLYPGGTNTPPEPYFSDGMAIARSITPLNKQGKPDSNGVIVWMSVGMSNTTQATRSFLRQMQDFQGLNPKVRLIDGAIGKQDINRISPPDAPYWQQVMEERLASQGITPEQVQLVWFKEAEARATDTTFVAYTNALKVKYGQVMQLLKTKFPNLKIVYLSPRTCACYAQGPLNPEPFAWYTGWAIKLLIAEQIGGNRQLAYKEDGAQVPWLTWGPYLWSNGTQPNAAGISYQREDYGPDGTHPSPAGQQKIGAALVRFFSSDPTAVPWFLAE